MESLALNTFGGFYAGKRVLLTGHTGFKGSWLALWLHAMGAQVSGLALDPNTEPSHWRLLHLEGISDHRVDLRNIDAVRKVLHTNQPDVVFHLAAQPLVRRSYRDPLDTFASNVTGLLNLLEAVRDCSSVQVLINATTDKVYAEHGTRAGYRETDPLGGHDPYSTSKACAELISDCYRKCYFHESGARLATARAGNVIGGGDWAEDRLIPDLARAGNKGAALQIRNPKAVRPWQHVLEPLSGYLLLAQRLWKDASLAGAWNFGPSAEGEIQVEALVTRLAAQWPALRIEHDDSKHPHEATVLRLNCEKAKQKLGWQPAWDIDKTLAKTAAWYRAFQQSGHIASKGDLALYCEDARRLGQAWAT